MQFKRTAVRTIIASRNLASAAGQAKIALINAIAGPARSPAAASAIAPLSVLSGLKSSPKMARASSAVGGGKQISVIALLGGLENESGRFRCTSIHRRTGRKSTIKAFRDHPSSDLCHASASVERAISF